MLSCSVLSNSVTPWTVAHKAPLSVGFSRQEYWRGLPFPMPGDLPNPGIIPKSSALQANSLLFEPLVKPYNENTIIYLRVVVRITYKTSNTAHHLFQ